MTLCSSALAKLYKLLRKCELDYNSKCYKRRMDIHPSVKLGDVFISGNVSIKEGTYMNSGQIITGSNSKVEIGEYCAIAENVQIRARTHDINNPTPPNHSIIEKDIIIGNHVWIGTNVYIREGIRIGNHAIVGANSVVTKDVLAYTVVAGAPARMIKKLK